MRGRGLHIVIAMALCAALSVPLRSEQSSASKQGHTFLRPLQQRDSVLIADQLRYGVALDGVEEGTSFLLPDISKGIMDSVRVLSPWMIDTVKRHKAAKGERKRYDIEASFILTSFEEGEYNLPPIPVVMVELDGMADTLWFDSQSLIVRSLPVDTTTFIPHDIKGQIKYPITAAEVLPWLGLGWLSVTLLILIVCLIILGKKGESADSHSSEPAHIRALRTLDGYRGAKWWAPAKQKEFYSGVTDALRGYMADRYGIPALEMTSAEIFDALSDKDVPQDLYEGAKDLFERADFVKFAKHTVSDEANAGVLPLAVSFVTRTYQETLEADAPESGSNKEEA